MDLKTGERERGSIAFDQRGQSCTRRLVGGGSGNLCQRGSGVDIAPRITTTAPDKPKVSNERRCPLPTNRSPMLGKELAKPEQQPYAFGHSRAVAGARFLADIEQQCAVDQFGDY